MKIVSCTTADDDETTCAVWSWLDKKCRSSSRNRRFVLEIKYSKGNNSITLGPTEMKFVSRTTAGDDETTREVWSQSDKKCRSSSRNRRFVLYFKSSKGNNSITLGPTEMKFMSRTTAYDVEPLCEVWSQSDKKCRSSSRNRRFVLSPKSSKGNNSTTLGPIEMKFMSRTTTYDAEPSCEVSSWSDKKCRSSSRNRHFVWQTERKTDRKKERQTERQTDQTLYAPRIKDSRGA